jgi:ectoine hydroxylase-related dioxygenase (phytanoyl-CoA dioxygenase family)
LKSQGYAVIKRAISPDKAGYYQRKALDWLKSFSTELDLDDPSTWTPENLPVQNKINSFNNYCVVHERFMWEARMEQGILDVFGTLWGTDELLVSFDALNITLPNRQKKSVPKPWPHIDQSPFRRGLHCVQGIINLSHAGPEDGSLILLPRSNTLTERFFDTQTDSSTWQKKDWRPFTETEMEWFHKQGVKPIKVLAEPGDLILWDSRTVHWGGEPTNKSDTIRTVIYASYSPAKLASTEALEEKQKAFTQYQATTHWAHDNITLRSEQVLLPDGTVDPRSRTKPLEEAPHTDRLLRLAGVKPYH